MSKGCVPFQMRSVSENSLSNTVTQGLGLKERFQVRHVASLHLSDVLYELCFVLHGEERIKGKAAIKRWNETNSTAGGRTEQQD